MMVWTGKSPLQPAASPLKPLPADHPVYSILNRVQKVDYTDYVKALGEKPPALPLDLSQARKVKVAVPL